MDDGGWDDYLTDYGDVDWITLWNGPRDHDHSERDHSKREPPKYRGEPLFSANLTWAVVAIGLLVSAIIAIAVLTSL